MRHDRNYINIEALDDGSFLVEHYVQDKHTGHHQVVSRTSESYSAMLKLVKETMAVSKEPVPSTAGGLNPF